MKASRMVKQMYYICDYCGKEIPSGEATIQTYPDGTELHFHRSRYDYVNDKVMESCADKHEKEETEKILSERRTENSGGN